MIISAPGAVALPTPSRPVVRDDRRPDRFRAVMGMIGIDRPVMNLTGLQLPGPAGRQQPGGYFAFDRYSGLSIRDTILVPLVRPSS